MCKMRCNVSGVPSDSSPFFGIISTASAVRNGCAAVIALAVLSTAQIEEYKVFAVVSL